MEKNKIFGFSTIIKNDCFHFSASANYEECFLIYFTLSDLRDVLLNFPLEYVAILNLNFNKIYNIFLGKIL